MKPTVVPLMTRLPGDLHAEVKREAEREDRSLNSMLVLLLRQGLAARRGGGPDAGACADPIPGEEGQPK